MKESQETHILITDMVKTGRVREIETLKGEVVMIEVHILARTIGSMKRIASRPEKEEIPQEIFCSI